MSRSVEEDYFLAILLYDIRADVLSDTPCFMSGNAGVPYVVEESGLAVVYMSHYGDDRRSFCEFWRLYVGLWLLRLTVTMLLRLTVTVVLVLTVTVVLVLTVVVLVLTVVAAVMLLLVLTV